MCWSDHTTRESSSPVSQVQTENISKMSLNINLSQQIYPMSGGSHHRYADTAEFYIKDR